MKIYLETKDANAHRIVFCSDNGKLVYSGEWVRRKATAYDTYNAFFMYMQDNLSGPIERPYKAGNFPKNSGPKKKKHTTK